ncbi:exodeoxyribonuclease VII small subunit [Fulvivirga sedimenti]|uniref:Exodeoxyribonuclease VII small subunit n=1 Tax=Fulvivirga sedimenti TaxID=2879465 RepID=A0A9X1HRN5_9BACT|nr:exodeoxyribonuclease VII small subunit [Fulvivirga sedimenti]MCA6074778.1 exodeoxyribonuclease VII small subunit [Fulvivirga sedimenti]MCA6075955.1 exodeoxyribonuclease VII small subunit [Fulvivirga sedimenti]MCA6077083.1 exodeoxyribonuclease VII small subunit [Fulvivirga sedimenti]
MSEKKEDFRFEDSLQQVEQIVERIEKGELDIDDLTSQVDKAAEILKKCREFLRKTEDDLENSLGELDQ